jgi:hypothetical protein
MVPREFQTCKLAGTLRLPRILSEGIPLATTHNPQSFQPFVAPGETRPELTLRAIVLGCIFGLIFGAVTVYVGIEAGLTVAASIPIAVLSISVLRALGRASILENNIVQTTGNAGQSIAAGVIFTLPALIFLGFDLEYFRIFVLAMLGGWLGLLFMIPLRRQLIVRMCCWPGSGADRLRAACFWGWGWAACTRCSRTATFSGRGRTRRTMSRTWGSSTS